MYKFLNNKILVFDNNNISPFKLYNFYLENLHSANILTENDLIAKYTGLKYIIWLDPAGKSRNVSHNSPRLKVTIDGVKYPVIFYPEVKIPNSVKPPSNIRKKIESTFPFINKNKNIFMQFWNHQISFEDVESMIKK